MSTFEHFNIILALEETTEVVKFAFSTNIAFHFDSPTNAMRLFL